MSWWLPLGDNWPRLLITAGLIGAVSLLEAISIAKALAEVNGDHVNADQELLGEDLWIVSDSTIKGQHGILTYVLYAPLWCPCHLDHHQVFVKAPLDM